MTRPIPEHLAAYAWYAPHLAYLRAAGHPPSHDPGDAEPRNADLRGADLHGAYLRGADLRAADLEGADLHGAYLRGADLRAADLEGADLRAADLEGADLHGADLHGANLRGATLPDGRTYEAYRADHLAGLCDAPEVRAKALAAWGEHEWSNCPMHAALGIDGLEDIDDEERRLLVAAWVALYDGEHIEKPEAVAS